VGEGLLLALTAPPLRNLKVVPFHILTHMESWYSGPFAQTLLTEVNQRVGWRKVEKEGKRRELPQESPVPSLSPPPLG
jgi:hypothetical protein